MTTQNNQRNRALLISTNDCSLAIETTHNPPEYYR